MKKLDPVVRKETLHILCGTAIGTVALQLIYVLLGQWNVTVLAGGLLGGCWAVLNFLLMGITVQHSVGGTQAEAHSRIKTSYSLRTLAMLAIIIAAFVLPWFHWVPVVAAMFYPRLTIAVMSLFRKEYGAPVKNPRPVEPEPEEDADELEQLLDKVYGGKVDYTAAAQTAEKQPSAAPQRKE